MRSAAGIPPGTAREPAAPRRADAFTVSIVLPVVNEVESPRETMRLLRTVDADVCEYLIGDPRSNVLRKL